MTDHRPDPGSTVALAKSELDGLLLDLQNRGYQTLGPTVKGQHLTYGPIRDMDDLPYGFSTEASPGRFELTYTDNHRYFDAVPGGESWKKYLFPPKTTLFSAKRTNGTFDIEPFEEKIQPRAFIGVRPCDLAAIDVQDRVFLRDDFADPIYRRRRENLFILAVECHTPCATGFCHSIGTG
ncbi:MAG: sulfite reductase subunit A, partial [Anaerolineales bacterium]